MTRFDGKHSNPACEVNGTKIKCRHHIARDHAIIGLASSKEDDIHPHTYALRFALAPALAMETEDAALRVVLHELRLEMAQREEDYVQDLAIDEQFWSSRPDGVEPERAERGRDMGRWRIREARTALRLIDEFIARTMEFEAYAERSQPHSTGKPCPSDAAATDEELAGK